jgi:hypothetical protein
VGRRKPALAPTARGRKLLALIAKQYEVAWPDWDKNPGFEASYNKLGHEITRLGRAIVATRVASLGAVVDRAILSAWWCQPHCGNLFGDDQHGFHEGSVTAVLKLARIEPWECCTALKEPA